MKKSSDDQSQQHNNPSVLKENNWSFSPVLDENNSDQSQQHNNSPVPVLLDENNSSFRPLYSFSVYCNPNSAPTPSWEDEEDSDEWLTSSEESSSSSSSDGDGGDWDSWEDDDIPSSNIIGRFTINPQEETVMVDAGREEFRDTDFFQFQEMVSAVEGLLNPDSNNVNDSWVEETILDNLKIRMYEGVADDEDTEKICAICQGEYETEEILASLECGHEYHADCIKKWLMRKNACPFCNRQGYKDV